MMLTAARKIHFAYGHRVWKHESKCKYFHGHNGVVWIYARSPELDSLGRVIDFSVLKEKVGGWIDEHWDHGFIYNVDDVETRTILKSLKEKKIYALAGNPTAENMANYLLRDVCPKVLFNTGVEVYKIVFYETENCFAEVSLDV